MLRPAHRLLVALAALVVLGPSLRGHPSAAPAAYIRHKLYELVARADLVVAGAIVGLEKETFDVAVETCIVGGPAADTLRVARFKDWTCAGRWTRYGVGQRVLLFLVRPPQGVGPWFILGGGGEGEMPLVGDSAVVRGYHIHGYEFREHEVAGGTCDGTLVALGEIGAAVPAFREAFTWNEGKGRLPIDSFDHRSEPQSLLLRDSSLMGRHLWEEVVTSAAWRHPQHELPFPVGAKRVEGQAHGFSGPARLAPGSFPDKYNSYMYSKFGDACDYVGDVDGDGVEDLAVGAPGDSYSGKGHGALWILLMDRTGELRRAVEVSEATSAVPSLVDFGNFGSSVTALGDLDCDGVPDLCVGRQGSLGSVLYLDRAGGVARSEHLAGPLGRFVGDLDGDGVPEHAFVEDPIGGSPFDEIRRMKEEGLSWSQLRETRPVAQVRVVSRDGDGQVRWTGGFDQRDLTTWPYFGMGALVGLGDVDGDRIPDLAIGNSHDLDGGVWRGAVWIVTLNRDGSLKGRQKISDWAGGFVGLLRDEEEFGRALACPGDLDGDGVPDLVAGGRTGIWVLFLKRDGTVKRHTGWTVDPPVPWIRSVATAMSCGSLRGDGGEVQLAVAGKIDGGVMVEDGVVWLLTLRRNGELASQ